MITITRYDIDSSRLTNKEKQKFHEYLTQQERKDKLLGLYKSVYGVVEAWKTMPHIDKQIKELERELNE